MKHLLNILIAVFLVTSISGCIVIGDGDGNWNHDDWREQQRENRELISELEINTPRTRVLTKLGAPNYSDAFEKNGKQYRILYYRTQHRHSDGDTTKDETTPLVFVDDQLVGWGEEALAKARSEI
ncbi:DUF3192 domain-containing protein [Aliikangiella coralliicola]|uniref:DUF3192 domain-containing protein n=1 Tax=Aliikangiella coralliicola TaxID=2592383 RepID=A0A545UFM1_9GAMM|nr:DUF3192 domain-containing protein [Aliikangiella coralliicola]TQV88183.1 DUF3192 domain-containing protein [Aliikangiella coralliicola]